MQIIQKPYWQDTYTPPDFCKLQDDIKCDVAIIGAGITGITTALLLSGSGMKIAVIEACKVAGSTTGKTTAKITTLHSLKLHNISSELGHETADMYYKGNQMGFNKIKDIIEKHSIYCDYTNIPAYVYTESSEGINNLENELSIMQKLGIKADITQDTHLPFPIISAIKVPNQAQFNPVKYVCSMAEIINNKDNCNIYEHSMVTKIDKDNPYKLYTDSAVIKADKIVLATNYPIIEIPGLFFAKLHQQKSYITAVEAGELDIKGMYINDVDPVNSARMHYTKQKNMLLLGGYGHKAGQQQPKKSYLSLSEWMKEKFIESASDIYQWGTQDCMTLDDLPYIGRVSKNSNIFVATGYSKWGMTNSTCAAVIITNEINGSTNDISELAKAFSPQRVNLKATKIFVMQMADTAKEYALGVPVPKGNIKDVLKGDGMVIKIDEIKTAVYKDENNNTKIFNPKCTHMGCTIAFNPDDKTWDCACHGSRFDLSGNVLKGPAKTPLNAVNLGIYES